MNKIKDNLGFCHTRLHLRFTDYLRILQVRSCKMEEQSGREETGLSLEQQQFLAVATLGFINIIPLLLDLVYYNCILFDFTIIIIIVSFDV